MVEEGELTVYVEAEYPLEKAALAHEKISEGHTKGKIIIAMD